MGFRRASGTPVLAWFPVDSTDTLYRGQLVKSSSDGVVPLDSASGANDATNDSHIVGIVVGDNNKTPLYDSTYKTHYITGVTTQADLAARDTILHEGAMYPKGDKRALVLVDIIDPTTWLYGPIFNASFGTAPTVITDSGGTDTTGYTTAGTTSACDFTPVADLCTIYSRSGANAGQYRITIDASTTAPQVTHAFMSDVAEGDSFVRVPLREGKSYIQTDSEGMFIDCSASPATNYWIVTVRVLDLSVAGKEHAIFRFSKIEHT